MHVLIILEFGNYFPDWGFIAVSYFLHCFYLEDSTIDTDHPQSIPATIVGSYGSFTAQFQDGMCLSFSAYGATGEPTGGETQCAMSTLFLENILVN